jgi:hypothetical protein
MLAKTAQWNVSQLLVAAINHDVISASRELANGEDDLGPQQQVWAGTGNLLLSSICSSLPVEALC